MASEEKKSRHLLGVGLDNEDGHKRLTRADDLTIVGGSAETHEKMTEVALKTFEDLRRKGKSLQEAESDEVKEIIARHAED